MDDGLKEIIIESDTFLDFHSVISGFRKVGLISLIENSSNSYYNKKYGKNIPVFEKQVEIVKEYLLEKRFEGEFFEAWNHLYFLAHNSKIYDCKQVLSKYKNPVSTKNGEKELGLLLNFPSCCVTAHITDEDIGRHEPFYVYPFAPCKEECILPWKQEYEKLAKKYNIDITKRIIK